MLRLFTFLHMNIIAALLHTVFRNLNQMNLKDILTCSEKWRAGIHDT